MRAGLKILPKQCRCGLCNNFLSEGHPLSCTVLRDTRSNLHNDVQKIHLEYIKAAGLTIHGEKKDELKDVRKYIDATYIKPISAGQAEIKMYTVDMVIETSELDRKEDPTLPVFLVIDVVSVPWAANYRRKHVSLPDAAVLIRLNLLEMMIIGTR